MIQDIGKYSHSITFETEVYPGVYWVPLHTLGKSRYTNEEMAEIALLSPQEKKACIRSLYEAVQLFQISDFKSVLDNVNHWFDNELWQTHTNQEDAVRSNEGCCATDTNWLAYFIKGFQAKGRNVPFCFYLRETDCVTATGLRVGEESLTFCIPLEDKPILLYCEEEKREDIVFVSLPETLGEITNKA